MHALLDPFSFLVVALAGWMNQQQQHVIYYLMEENRVLREQIGNRRMRFSDNQRRRLAAKARTLSQKLLAQVATIDNRHTGNFVGVASEANCQEIPWQRVSIAGPA